MSNINPTRLDRRFLFGGAATELEQLPLESGPVTYNDAVAESVALSERVAATGGTAILVSRDFEADTADKGEYAGAIFSAYPFTFAAWVKPESVGTAGVIFAIATNGSANNYFRVDISSTGAVRVRARDGSSVSDAITTSTMSAGTWYLVAAVFNSDTDRRAFLNADKQTNSTSRIPSGVNRTTVGATTDTQGTGSFDGLIAYPTLWNVALSDSEVAQLAGGTYPTGVQGGAIVSHWPFPESDPGVDPVGGFRLTFTGTAHSSDAPSIGQPGAGGGTTYNDTLSESLTAADSLAATATFVATVTEALTAADANAATVQFATTLAESLATSDSLAAAATFAAALSEAITATDAVTDGGSTTYNESVSEALTAADSLAAAVTFAVTRSEALAAADSLSAAAAFAAAVSESGTLVESLAAAATMVTARAEALTAADSASAALTFTLSRSEALTASEALLAAGTLAPTISEALAAGDSLSALATFNATVGETLIPADAYADEHTRPTTEPVRGIGWTTAAERLHYSPRGRLHYSPTGRLHWTAHG